MTICVVLATEICQHLFHSALTFFTTVLARIRSTSPGPEEIPFWLYKTCAVELGPVVAKLVNFSLTQRIVPLVWKTAHITPVPKTSIIKVPGDLRPISVTSILSRTVEKVVVKNYLTPLLDSTSFYDQYAYKPTGSTTCALADLTYRVHTLLESNQYVRCVLIDFSKAFDTVDHAILSRKLFSLNVPVFIIQWIMSFLTNRTQATRLGFHLSAHLPINRSIVQGSGIGPTLFIMFAHDLRPLDILNYLIKYADDTTLLCPQISKTTVELEMAHVIDWANENKMAVNLLKTVELVFHRPNVSHDLSPLAMPNVSRVACAKLLGVHLRHDLNFSQHVESVVAICNQRLYLLAQLKKQGLGMSNMDYIFNAIVLNKILYALPVYFGYLTEGQKHMLQRVLHRANRRGFTSHYHDLDTLAESAQCDLFRHSRHSAHCLHHLYTAKLKPPGAMRLRARGHDFELPTVKYEFNKQNFVVRSLFQYV